MKFFENHLKKHNKKGETEMSGLSILLILGMIVAIIIFASVTGGEFGLMLALGGIPALMCVLCVGWKMASPYWVIAAMGVIVVGLCSIMRD